MSAETGAPFVVQTKAGGKWTTAARCQGEAEARKAFDRLVSPPALEHARIIVGAYSKEKGKVVYKLVTEVDPSTETVSGEAATQAAFAWSDVDAKKAGQGLFALAFWGLVLWYGGGWVWGMLSGKSAQTSAHSEAKTSANNDDKYSVKSAFKDVVIGEPKYVLKESFDIFQELMTGKFGSVRDKYLNNTIQIPIFVASYYDFQSTLGVVTIMADNNIECKLRDNGNVTKFFDAGMSQRMIVVRGVVSEINDRKLLINPCVYIREGK